MKLTWSKISWEDYLYWQKVDKKMVKRINELIKNCSRTPFEGIGKPEALKGDLQNYWSRRITFEHRLVYTYKKDELLIASCRYHYQKLYFSYSKGNFTVKTVPIPTVEVKKISPS